MGLASSTPVPHLDRLVKLTERAQDRRSSLWPKTDKDRAQDAPVGGWKCPSSLACPSGRDHSAADLFCSKCGSKKPERPRGWKCPSSRACPGGRDHTAADLFCCKCGSKKPEQGGRKPSKKGSKKSRRSTMSSKKPTGSTSKKPTTETLPSVQEEFYDDTPLVMHSNECMPGAFRRYSSDNKPDGKWSATSNECVPDAFQRYGRPAALPSVDRVCPLQDAFQRYGRPRGAPSMDRYPSHLSD
jgi:hypothetical protein